MISREQFDEMERRVAANKRHDPTSEGDQEIIRDAVALEIPLHNQIIKHCNSQWPQWKYIHANPSKKSTMGNGAPDFVIFLPGGKTLCMEIKTGSGKLSRDQLAWKHEMWRLEHAVHVVRSYGEFIKLV